MHSSVWGSESGLTSSPSQSRQLHPQCACLHLEYSQIRMRPCSHPAEKTNFSPILLEEAAALAKLWSLNITGEQVTDLSLKTKKYVGQCERI